MNNEEVKLNILLDILKEKISLLNVIQNICDNQKTILESTEKSAEILHFFKETALEKQKSIDKILSLDESFNNTYDQLKDLFNDRAKSLGYRSKIKEIQNGISEVEFITDSIKSLESSNDIVVSKLRKTKNQPSKHSLVKMKNIYGNINKK